MSDCRVRVRPLLSGGRRVLVDDHPICDSCGRAVERAGADEWRHGDGRGAARAAREELQRLPKFREYRARLQSARRSRAIDDNPYLGLARLLCEAPPEEQRLLDLPARRRELASLFSWAIPSEPALQALARYAPLVECGAGSGYWAALLRARGVDVLAYDVAPPGTARNAWHRGRRPWTQVRRAAAAAAARRHSERALLLCWPPYDDDAASYGALRAFRGDVVIHIGEPDGATGSVRFRRELALNWTLAEALELPRWPRLRDQLMVYRRNPVRLPHVERDRCFECRRYMPTGAIGRCDACFALRPPALALRVGRHRVEYPRQVVEAMPAALRKAFEMSPARIRPR